MTTPFEPLCYTCKNRFIDLEQGFLTCKAFGRDKQIPIEIMESKHDHNKPFPGDNGIRFEKE